MSVRPIYFKGDFPPATSDPGDAQALRDKLNLEFGVVASATRIAADLPVSVKDFGARGNGASDDSAAFQRAFTFAASLAPVGSVMIPIGRYVITQPLTVASEVGIYGAGSENSVLIFRPTANGTCLTVTAGVSQAIKNVIKGIGFYSDDTTYTKVALDLVDVSSCEVDDIMVTGTGTGFVAGPFWSGGGASIGIRTRGREASTISNVRLVADYPLYHGPNPNTVRADCEDLDHWNFHNCYLVANGHHSVRWEDGIGGSHISYDGYQAWVGGTGGIKINDTRVAPTIVSRNITISNVRGEQSSDASAHWGDFTFTQPVETLTLTNWLGASTANGISINGSLQVILDGCIMAMGAGTTSLVMAGQQGGSTLNIRGCYWQPSSTFTTTGLLPIFVPGFDPSTVSGPTDAFFAGVRVGSYCILELLSAVCAASTIGFQVFATSGGDGACLLPLAAGSGFTLRSENAAKTDFTPMQLVSSALDIRYRTGVGTSATAVSTDASGNLVQASGKTLQLGTTYSAGVVAATGTIAIKDSTGTTYNVLVHT